MKHRAPNRGKTQSAEGEAQRQVVHVSANRGRVPAAFADRIALDDHQKAADYTLANVRLGRLELLYSVLLLLVWTLGGGLQWLDSVWQGPGWTTIATGVAVMISAFLAISILELPFSLYHTFVIEQRFGFNRTTLRSKLKKYHIL